MNVPARARSPVGFADLGGHDPPLPEALKRETRVLPQREVEWVVGKIHALVFCLYTCVDKGIG